MQVAVGAARPPGAEPGERAWHAVQVIGEVLAAEALLGRHHPVRAEHALRPRREHRGAGRLVHRRGHVALIVQLHRHAIGAGHRLDELAEQGRRRLPGLVVQAADGAFRDALVGNRVRGRARAYPAPHQAEAGPGIDPAGQHGRQLGHDLAERVHHVGGEVRAGGVPARAAHVHLDVVAGGGDRPGPDAQLADVKPGVAVHREDPADRRQAARGDDVLGPGAALFVRLEDQPDRPGQQPGPGLLREEQASPEDHGGVHVVAARVAGAGDRGPVRDVFLVVHREGIEVGPQSHHRTFGVGRIFRSGDIGEQPGAPGKHHGVKARRGQALGDDARGAVFRPPCLRVGVQVPAERDQRGPAVREKLVQAAPDITLHDRHPREGRSGPPRIQ